MALFKNKKTIKKTASMVAEGSSPKSDLKTATSVLLKPRITEKATVASFRGVYVFNIADSATKSEVAKAVYKKYNVHPRLVRVAQVVAKKKRNPRTGQTGIKSGGKKAYVYLKQGDTISIS